ncbi:DinB family protein [Brevibacterium metallidurans]|uniref:DinB family protein n=1 Tax=Brevibacterium metallidurans TaxID=1482676 RepID=A0ABP3C5S1_9MICO
MSLPLDDPRPRPNEREGLVDFLEYQRQVLRRKVDGLSAENLGRTAAASSLTLGGLIRHLTFVENLWFLDRVAGEGMPAPWTDVDWKADPDWDFNSAADLPPADLIAGFETACAASRTVLEGIDDLDAPLSRKHHGQRLNVRWVLIHMIEEYARHAGHADLLRESIDGRVGD